MYLCSIILTINTMAKNYLWMLLLLFSLALAACTKDGNTIYLVNPDEEQPSTAPLVTVIYGPNSLGDRAYCDKIYRGIEATASKRGLRTLHLMPESMEQGLTYLEMMFQQMESAQDSVRRLFIVTSPVYDEFIRKNNRRLEKNPNADLLYMETTTPLEGKGSTLYIDYYGAMYMSGYLVNYAHLTLVTLLLANPYTQSVTEAGEGFLAGFNDIPLRPTQSLELHVRYLSDEPSGGFTIADTTAMRIFEEEKKSIKAGGTISFVPVCGGAMHAIIRILRTMNGSDSYVGIDGDMTGDKDFCIFSTLKHIDRLMEDYVGLWLNGTMPKHQTFGLADGATDVVITDYAKKFLWNDTRLWDNGLNMDSIRQVAIRKEGERYGK